MDRTISALEHPFVCALAPCTLWLKDESCWDIELETNSHVYFYCVLQLYMSEFEMRVEFPLTNSHRNWFFDGHAGVPLFTMIIVVCPRAAFM